MALKPFGHFMLCTEANLTENPQIGERKGYFVPWISTSAPNVFKSVPESLSNK